MRALASALARERCSCMSVSNAVAVDGETGLFGDLEREVDREAVGVVQQEGLGPASVVPPAFFVSSSARSRIVEPDASVRRNVSSSAKAYADSRDQSFSSSG